VRSFKFVRDQKAFELMADNTRRQVIHLLRAKEMTVSQVAQELQKTPQAIYQQLRKLLEAELVEVAKEERIDHFIETYYRASAEVFEFVHGEGKSESYGEERTRDALTAIGRLGISPLRVDSETTSKIVKISNSMNALALPPELEEKIADLEGVDFIGKQELAKHVNMLMMTDKQFEEYMDLQREHRNLLKSALAKPVQASTKKPRIARAFPSRK
jgi:DNA-binding transcriptional ArsR family regulator